MTTTNMGLVMLPDWAREQVPVAEVQQWIEVFNQAGSLGGDGLWALSRVICALNWEVAVLPARKNAARWIEWNNLPYGLDCLKTAGEYLLWALDAWETAVEYSTRCFEDFAGSVWAGWMKTRQQQLTQVLNEVVRDLQAWRALRGGEMSEKVGAWLLEQERRLSGVSVLEAAGQSDPGSYSE